MKILSKKFGDYVLNTEKLKGIKGGDDCSNCVHSAFIACNASCGGGGCSVSACVNSQVGQCMGQTYCL
jgi:hypothetical protein